MKKSLIFGVIGLFFLDQFFPRLADRQIRSSGVFESAQSTLMPNLEGLTDRSENVCEFTNAYVVYLYQVCFRPYTSGTENSEDGYHLVYHKPKPKFTLIMSANNRNNYYFNEMVQGEFILFVQRDGSIRYGDSR
jgi:hypothetical protein